MIMGIDPGTRNIGFAVIRRDGSFQLSGVLEIAEEHWDREMIVALDYFLTLIREHVEEPWWWNTVAVEGCYVGGNLRLAARLGEVVGLVHAVAIVANVGFLEIAPAQGRKAVAGSGNATDAEAIKWACVVAGRPGLTIHEADALGVALAALEITGKYHEEEVEE